MVLSKDYVRDKIITNKIKCLVCLDVIESKFTHDFVKCGCGNVAVDGGKDYLKRSFVNGDWEEMSVVEEIKDERND